MSDATSDKKINGEITEKVQKFLSLTGWSSARLAKSAGIASSTLSQFMSGQYPGDNAKITDKLENTIEREYEKLRQTRTTKTFVETSVWKRYYDIARSAHLFQEIFICYSDAGIGKTECGREYARRYPDTLFIEANPTYTATSLFQELYRKLGSEEHKTINKLFNSCADALGGSGRLLIIDEAEQLSYRALNSVRALHDKTGIGVLLTGMHKLLNNICGQHSEYGQLYSRCSAYKLSPLSDVDTRDILRAAIPGEGDNLWSRLHKESCGNTRRLLKLVNRSIYIANANHCSITDDVIDAACTMVKVERLL